jgi:hypothetical protein
VEITNEQYSQGAVDFTPVFLFQEQLTEQQDQLAVAQGDIALGLIAVYRALGGGWQIRLGAAGNAEPATLEVIPLPELPAPGDDQNDIQFQSFIDEFATNVPADAEAVLQTSATVSTPAPITLLGTAQ